MEASTYFYSFGWTKESEGRNEIYTFEKVDSQFDSVDRRSRAVNFPLHYGCFNEVQGFNSVGQSIRTKQKITSQPVRHLLPP